MTAVMSVLIGVFLLGLFYTLGILAAPGSTPPTARERALLGLLPVVGSICGVLALFIAGSLLMARGNTGSLVISGDGVSVWSRRTRTASWSHVRDIRLVGETGPEPKQAALIVDGNPEELRLTLHLAQPRLSRRVGHRTGPNTLGNKMFSGVTDPEVIEETR
jgi:hypothetical protein